MKWLSGFLCMLLTCLAPGASVFTYVPQKVDPARQYLIDLHGVIIEGRGAEPMHPKFGVYDYPGILKALGSRDAVVISQDRRTAPTSMPMPAW